MKIYSRVLSLVLVACASLALVACGSQQSTEQGGSGEEMMLRISYHNTALPFAAPIREGVEAAAEDYGIDAELIGPTGGGAQEQISGIEAAVASGADGLAVSSASTDALSPVINRVIEQQEIPVITFNTSNPESNASTFVGQDLVESGEIVAEQLVNRMGEEGKVLVFTVDEAAQWSRDREQGVRNYLEDYPGVEIVDVVNTGSSPQEAYAAIENSMTANPEVSGVISLDCCSFPQAGRYLDQRGLAGDVTAVGFDLEDQTLDYIDAGVLQATVSQNPYKQGYQAVETLYEMIEEDKTPPELINTGASVVDESNVEEQLEENTERSG